ncbi:MAG: outer membrane lipoprotein-sorting protein [Desulfobacteraceae bacterium]|nr:outer membrane lipoprotein-sorting protein [Desulfobacteraceae bacterium]
MRRRFLFILVTGFILVAGFLPLDALAVTGREVMVMVDERDDGNDRKSVVEMTLVNHRGKKRVRKMLSYSKDYGKDAKKLMYFQKPMDVKGTSFLSWEYDNPGTDDDKWLYMPALRKVRRISGKSTKDYFMGSDFTYDDMGDRNVDEDTHTLKGEEVAQGADCWVVESVPVDDDDNYDKKIVWVRKDAAVVVKAEYYDSQGLIKTFLVHDLKKQDNIWTIFEMEMNNPREDHTTIMKMMNVEYNIGVKDGFFKVATISRGVIR